MMRRMNLGKSSISAKRARYIMIGGFLGAGKTTAVSKLARRLKDQGLRVGLITNDQGNQLVDTATLTSQGYAVEEISGGCFCCRFNSLMDAANQLTTMTRPDVFIAEPVGSCTDLVATVTYPLRRIYGDLFTISPLSVVMDPIRAGAILGVRQGRKFSPKVAYIYGKQLEEADFLVINKSDLISPEESQDLRQALTEKYPDRKIFEVSARSGEGLDLWYDSLLAFEQIAREAMEVDYETYGEGEALLGWLNATLEVKSDSEFDGNDWVQRFAEKVRRRLLDLDIEIAHLKMTLSPDVGLGEIAVINVVRNDYVAELGQSLQDGLASGQLIVNLRAEGAPEALEQCVVDSINEISAEPGAPTCRLDHMERFRPSPPQPTHRQNSF